MINRKKQATATRIVVASMYQRYFSLLHKRELICTSVACLVALLLLSPWRSLAPIHQDEGYNLMKAFLLLNGHKLYSDVWSDQPPVFTYTLEVMFRIFGASLSVGRLLIIAYSTVLLTSLYWIIRRHLGVGIARIALCLLILNPMYIKLSAGVMIGLPAYSLSCLAVAILESKNCQTFAHAISGATMSLAVLTKFSATLAIPALILMLLVRSTQRPLFDRAKCACAWCFAFLVTFSMICYFTHIPLALLWQVHLTEPLVVVESGQNSSSFLPVALSLRDNGYLVFLFLLGTFRMLTNRIWTMLPAYTWALFAICVHLIYMPFWNYYELHYLVPIVVIASQGIAFIYKFIRKLYISSNKVLTFTLVSVILVLFGSLSRIKQFGTPGNAQEAQSTEHIMRLLHNSANREFNPALIISDMPFFCFSANLAVPPELAVLSYKRFASGFANELDLLNCIKKYSTTQILLELRYGKLVERALHENYELISDDCGVRYYLRKPIDKHIRHL